MQPSPDLLQRCCKDDRKAHYELYNMCFPFVLSICKRYYVNNEDMKSALNLIFVKAVKNISKYIKKDNEVPFELWLRRISINHIIDEFRKSKNYRETIELSDGYETEYLHPSGNSIAEKYKAEEIERVIETLPLMSRTVFNMSAIDGYNHEEIAAILNISVNTSKVHLHRARKKLQELITNQDKKKRLIPNTILQ